MTQSHRTTEPEHRKPTTATAMRLIVPLQGVVQGRGGLILGSLIPCALFYFLQFYLKRHRSPNPPSPSASSSNLAGLPRTSSRSTLSSRGSLGPVRISARGSSIAKPDDSPYYIGLNKFRDDPYDKINNPNGIIQLGLAENTVNLNLSYSFSFLYLFICICRVNRLFI